MGRKIQPKPNQNKIRKRSIIAGISALALVAGVAVFNNINHENPADAALAPAGSTPSDVTCAAPGTRGSGSCDVDVSVIDPGLNGTLTFVLGNSGESDYGDGGTMLPTFNSNTSGTEAMAVNSGTEAMAVNSGSGISGSGTLAIPNSILVNGTGSSIPVTQTRQGNIFVGISATATVIIPNTITFIGEGSGSDPDTGVTNMIFEDGGTEQLTLWGGGLGIGMPNLTEIEFRGRLACLCQDKNVANLKIFL